VGGRVDQVFDALADPTRRFVVEVLAGRESASQSELAAQLPVTRQAVAKHLATLHAAGLVRSERRGRETRYALDTAPLDEAAAWLERVGSEWDARLAALARHVGGRGAARS
jgi:DNA-binding transcriptional ArsR family regulator